MDAQQYIFSIGTRGTITLQCTEIMFQTSTFTLVFSSNIITVISVAVHNL